MVVYLDLVFFLNSIADALALYVTSRLSGISLRPNRVILASVLGGIYGVICSVPLFCFMRDFVPQVLVAAFLVWVVFGLRTIYLRLCLLFFVLSRTHLQNSSRSILTRTVSSPIQCILSHGITISSFRENPKMPPSPAITSAVILPHDISNSKSCAPI